MPADPRIEAFKKFVEQKPEDPFPRYSLAMAYRSAGQLAEAVSEFETLVARAPSYIPTYLMLGQTLEQLGRKRDAAMIYKNGMTAATQAGNGHAQGELMSAYELVRSASGE